jgi:hypothetical protein
MSVGERIILKRDSGYEPDWQGWYDRPFPHRNNISMHQRF